MPGNSTDLADFSMENVLFPLLKPEQDSLEQGAPDGHEACRVLTLVNQHVINRPKTGEN